MRVAPAVVGVAALTLLLAACAPEPGVEGPGADPAAPAPTEAPGGDDASGPADPDATPEPVGDPTCETIIPASVVAQFEELKWTARADEFRIGETVVPDGIQCVWGDHTVASDHVQVYGWAPIDADMAQDAQAALEAQGWLREEADDVLYLTEDPDYAIATDNDGYGMTYEFGDGWVALADTKQGLLIITWPPA